MKTIREWFEELPEPYRTEATGNMNNEVADVDANSMYEAITRGFIWNDTPEGDGYWREFRKNYAEIKDAPSFSSPSPHRLFEQIAEYVDKHDLKTYKILVTDGVAELITED